MLRRCFTVYVYISVPPSDPNYGNISTFSQVNMTTARSLVTPDHTFFPQSLESLDVLLNNRGALFEGNIFSALWHLPFVVRSFEFALVDGTLDCNNDFTGASYADRLWEVNQRSRREAVSGTTPNKLLHFDVKSSTAQDAGKLYYITTSQQQRHVAFFIGTCAADPSFVELIPNFQQGRLSSVTDATPSPLKDIGEGAVNSSRSSRLPPSAYKLDPCNSPYRMPLALFPEAVCRVRRCGQTGEVYVNPWTLVSFPNWRPVTTSSSEYLLPREDSQHATACEAALEIYRIINKEQAIRSPFKMDFIFLQPRLADFKFIPNIGHGTDHPEERAVWSLIGDQALIQHKLDSRERAYASSLSNVAIARGQGEKCRWYFEAYDRFVPHPYYPHKDS